MKAKAREDLLEKLRAKVRAPVERHADAILTRSWTTTKASPRFSSRAPISTP